MSDNMSIQEWRARAALLGMTYARLGHYFYKFTPEGTSQRYCADTMQPLTLDQTLDGPTLFNSIGWPIKPRIEPKDPHDIFIQEARQ